MAAAKLINHPEPLSTSEVGLNFPPHRASTRPMVPVHATNRDHRWAFVPVRGTNRYQCPPMVPVRDTNRDHRPQVPALWAAEKRP